MKLISLLSLAFLLGLAGACTTAIGDLNDEDAAPPSAPEARTDGGAGGAEEQIVVECTDEAPSGAAGSCEAVDPDNDCQTCVATHCCDEQSQCNASGPDAACSFGSTMLDGAAIDGGEIACMMECFVSRKAAGTFKSTAEDVTACEELCGASECGARGASATTTALASCIIGLKDSSDGCRASCGF